MIERFAIAGYARISVDEELDRDNVSIENQKAIIEDFVKHRFPDSTLTFYEDRDRSGYTFEQREGYQEMRRGLMSHKYDILIVKDFSRFSRRNSRGLVELEDLRDAGARIISIGDGVDFPNDDDWLKIQFQFLVNEMPVTVIAMERGTTIEERMKRNFGCPSPEGYRKALRLMKQAEKFNRPVICIINSSGAYCGIGAEERGQGLAIAENLMEMMTLKTPVVSVVTGEGGSGGALALSVADSIFMLENAVYSVISPEGCASILWKDSSKAPDAAEALKLTAKDLHKFGIVETVIDEENRTNEEICDELKVKLVKEIKRLSKLDIDDLLDDRYEKFRKIGNV